MIGGGFIGNTAKGLDFFFLFFFFFFEFDVDALNAIPKANIHPDKNDQGAGG